MDELKRCPYCGEEILAIASKCKHCKEFLNETDLLNESEDRKEETERTIWYGKPSHLSYLGTYIIGSFLAPVAGIGLFMIIYAILDRHFKEYTITTRRVKTKSGIISRTIDEVLLKNIRSVNVNQGIIERLFGLGTINIGSAGTSGIEVSFAGISNPIGIKNELQKLR
jgi:membrane protein YdbS with pleckstrin-like domain